MVGVSLLSESFPGRVKLEGPQEVVGFFEVGADSVDFINEILNCSDAVLSKLSLNNAIVSEGKSAFVDLSISSLVDKVSDGLLGRVAIGDIGLNSSDHVDGGLVKSNKGSIVQLSQSQELQNFLAGGVKFVDTIQKITRDELLVELDFQLEKSACHEIS